MCIILILVYKRSRKRDKTQKITNESGVVWTIFIFVQNDREKKTKNKKQKKALLMVLVLATLGLRQKLPFRDVPMM